MNGTNNKIPNLRTDRRGQVLIESLLLMVVSIGLLSATLQYFREAKTFSKITNAVWLGVGQMGEYGNWPGANSPIHPNSSIRVRLLDP